MAVLTNRVFGQLLATRSQLLPCRPLLVKLMSDHRTVGENMELRKTKAPLTYHSPHGSGTPLVVMLGWLLARTKHLTKYSNIYCSKGFDVLEIKVKPTQVLWPIKAQTFIEKIFTVLEKEDYMNKPILVHGFSVGGYLYGEMLVKMFEEPEKYAALQERIVGQIFDSPVDKDRVAYGMSLNLVKNPLMQFIVFHILDQYLKIFQKSVTVHFTKAHQAFVQNKLGIPSLVFYSYKDPIANPQVIENTVKMWASTGIPVLHKSWHDSQHVSHLQKHPEEYVEILMNFIEKLPLVCDSNTIVNSSTTATTTTTTSNNNNGSSAKTDLQEQLQERSSNRLH